MTKKKWNFKLPDSAFMQPLRDEHIAKAMNKVFSDFDINVDDDTALRVFYSIITNFIYFLDYHPGVYFKTKYFNMVKDQDNYLAIEPSIDYPSGSIDTQALYELYGGSEALKAELANHLDIFAQSFLGIREPIKKEYESVDQMLDRREELAYKLAVCDKRTKAFKRMSMEEKYRRVQEANKIKKNRQKKLKEGRLTMSRKEISKCRKKEKKIEKFEQELLTKYAGNSKQLPY